MPATLVDRLPLPNLKVYTAGSVLLLAMSVYYALSVTSDPRWRVNSTQEASPPDATLHPLGLGEGASLGGTRNVTAYLTDIFTFMMQEPLCMWTVINMSYCSVALCGAHWFLCGVLLQRAVFGSLRAAESQRLRDKLCNYVFYKFIFVFGVVNVHYMDEVLLWCAWFTALGSLHLLAHLCRDRFDYLCMSGEGARGAHARLAALLVALFASCSALLVVAVKYGLPIGRDTFAFMAAECVLVLVCVCHVLARYALLACGAGDAHVYYTQLVFETGALGVEAAHVLHMVAWSNMAVSMASLVLLMQLRHVLHALQARLRRHRHYAAVSAHMDRNYRMASKQEMEANSDNCAICWEPMKEARRLPCTHLFHNSCLSQWLQQDASCPTCRRGLAATRRPAPPPPHPAAPPAAPPAHNHLFHFDGSRYVSWLPSFSVEVTRVRLPRAPPAPLAPLAAPHVDAMARQVQAMFPHYALETLAADLLATRALDLTVDNILEGRLVPPPPAPPAPPPAPAPDVTTHADDTQTLELERVSEFGASSSEREATLQRRKQALLASARRRYVQRAVRDPAPAHPVPPAPPAPPAHPAPAHPVPAPAPAPHS